MSAGQDWPLRELAETLALRARAPGRPLVGASRRASRPRGPTACTCCWTRSVTSQLRASAALPDDGDPAGGRSSSAPSHRRLVRRASTLALLRRAGAVFALDQRVGGRPAPRWDPGAPAKPGLLRAPRPLRPDRRGRSTSCSSARHSRRRTEYLSRAAPVLARHNCLLSSLIRAPPAPRTRARSRPRAAWPLLAQTKVVINLHHGEEHASSGGGRSTRSMPGPWWSASTSSGLAPLVAGEHLLVASPDALPFVRRVGARATRSGWPPFGSRPTSGEQVDPLALRSRSCAPALVELVGEPIASRAHCGEPTPCRCPARASRRARAGGSELGVAPPIAPVRTSSDAHSGDRRLELGAARASDRWVACQPGLARRRAPRVSVADGADADEPARSRDAGLAGSPAGCATSSWSAVDAGAERAALEREAWIRDHPASPPGCVAPGGTERRGARNRRWPMARGPLLPDPRSGAGPLSPLPRGARRARSTALADVAFVYPILEVTDASDAFAAAGGDYLTELPRLGSGAAAGQLHPCRALLIRTGAAAAGGLATERPVGGSRITTCGAGWPSGLAVASSSPRARPGSGVAPCRGLGRLRAVPHSERSAGGMKSPRSVR